MEDQTLSSLFRQMSMLFHAGVAPEEAVSLLLEESTDDSSTRALRAVGEKLAGGASLSDAVAACGEFPTYAADLIRVGETAGRLDSCAASLAEYYERREKFHTWVREALTYPVVLLLMMCGVLAVLVFAVLPVFTGVYENLAGSLSGSSYGYVAVAGVVGKVSLVAAAVVSVLALVLLFASSRDDRSPLLRRCLKCVPSAEPAVYQLALGSFTGALAALLSSGMDPESSLTTAASLVTHQGLRESLKLCEQDVSAGGGLARSLKGRKLYSPLQGRLLISGAETGELERTLSLLAGQLRQEGQTRLQRIIDMVEPVLTIFLTVCVGLSLLCAMLPLIGILGAIG